MGDGRGLSQGMVQRRLFSSHEDAFEFLRVWLADPAMRAELMRVLQRSGPSLVILHAGQDGWAHALAARLASGAIVVLEERYQTSIPGRLAPPANTNPAAVDITALPLLSEISPVFTVTPAAAAAAASAAAAAAPAAPAAATPTQAVVDDPAPLQDMDLQIAQAVAFEQAAAGAVPFCEICNRLRAEQQQDPGQAAPLAPAEAAPENAQQLAQAETFEEAAKTGAPFCEICEQQRLAREKEENG